MRVLIANDGPFAHYYIRLAIARVLTSMGHEVIMWDINKKPAFDAFDEMNPDLFIGQTFNLNNAVMQCIHERPEMKVIMKASDWGTLSDTIDREKYPVLIAKQAEVDRVLELHDRTGRPNLVYVHYHKDRLKQTHCHWSNNGIKVESLMNAADIFDFTNGQVKDEYKCDLGFVGGRWGYKSVTLDKWLLPMLHPGINLNIKIFGNQPWGVSQYCGFLPDSEVKHFLRSAKICPNLSEPHSQKYGYDVIERPFKLLANKCFVISDYVEDLAKLFPSQIIHSKTPEDFMQDIKKWLSVADREREDKVEAGYEEVMDKHTYFHRVADIFKGLGMQDEAEKCMDKLDEIKGKLKL